MYKCTFLRGWKLLKTFPKNVLWKCNLIRETTSVPCNEECVWNSKVHSCGLYACMHLLNLTQQTITQLAPYCNHISDCWCTGMWLAILFVERNETFVTEIGNLRRYTVSNRSGWQPHLWMSRQRTMTLAWACRTWNPRMHKMQHYNLNNFPLEQKLDIQIFQCL